MTARGPSSAIDIAANSWTPVLRADGALAITPGNVADGGALTTDGTFIYAFQGKTTAFWRYDIAADAWTVLAPFSAAHRPGRRAGIRARRQPAGPAHDSVCLPLAGRHRRRGQGHPPARFEHSGQQRRRGAADRDADGRRLVQHPDRARRSPAPTTTTSTAADAVVYEWTCTVAAGATPGSLTFSASGTGDGPLAFPAATSNSVLVSPPLTFTATVPAGAPEPDRRPGPADGERADDELAARPDVHRPPVLTIVKSNSPTVEQRCSAPGDPITYTMVVENTGVGDATNVVVSDAVPANTGYASCSGGTSCGAAAGTVTWNVGTLAPGASATVSFTVSTSTTLPISATPVHDPEHGERHLDRDADAVEQQHRDQPAPGAADDRQVGLGHRGGARRHADLHADGSEPRRGVHGRCQRRRAGGHVVRRHRQLHARVHVRRPNGDLERRDDPARQPRPSRST